eukprot:Skav202254  [mRNA]  locus=scaffold1417:310693:313730:+ [translate_table: standard]
MSGLPRSFRHIQMLAKQQSHTLTLGQLMRNTRSDSVSLIRQGQWLRNQLPIRFARRLDEFLQLPYLVVHNQNIKQVFDIYVDTFETVSDFPRIMTDRDEAAFADVIRKQLEKHQQLVAALAVKLRVGLGIGPFSATDRYGSIQTCAFDHSPRVIQNGRYL